MCRSVTCALLSIFNAIVLVIGIVATVVGACLRWNQPMLRRIIDAGIGEYTKYTDVDVQTMKNRFYAAIQDMASPVGLALFIFGIILVAIAIIAYVGLCCNFKILVIVYAVVIGMLVIIHLIYIIIYFSNRNLILKYPMNYLKETVMGYTSISTGDEDSLILGYLMPHFHCCGYENGNDFHSSGAKFTGEEYYNQQNITVKYPVPCCKSPGTDQSSCPYQFTSSNSYIDTGCKEPVKDKLKDIFDIVTYVSIVMLIFDAIAFILAVIHICIPSD
ncbi:unnamed protein product [Calicophoron daubneyi]|uniref:Tetraspanin n=1 Tax=Calicophoron daubneyi TaxID=300641 RepID=A0AAV2TIH1_CALDB